MCISHDRNCVQISYLQCLFHEIKYTYHRFLNNYAIITRSNYHPCIRIIMITHIPFFRIWMVTVLEHGYPYHCIRIWMVTHTYTGLKHGHPYHCIRIWPRYTCIRIRAPISMYIRIWPRYTYIRILSPISLYLNMVAHRPLYLYYNMITQYPCIKYDHLYQNMTTKYDILVLE